MFKKKTRFPIPDLNPPFTDHEFWQQYHYHKRGYTHSDLKEKISQIKDDLEQYQGYVDSSTKTLAAITRILEEA